MEGSGYAYDILHKNGYKIMHIQGATDGLITMAGTWKWIQDRKLKTSQAWTPYSLSDGSFFANIKQYENLTLVTIHAEG